MPQAPINRSKPPKRRQQKQNPPRKPPQPRPKPPRLKLLRMLQRPMSKKLNLLKMPPRLTEMETKLQILRRNIKLQRILMMQPRKRSIL